jgi:hypothetical protein
MYSNSYSCHILIRNEFSREISKKIILNKKGVVQCLRTKIRKIKINVRIAYFADNLKFENLKERMENTPYLQAAF